MTRMRYDRPPSRGTPSVMADVAYGAIGKSKERRQQRRAGLALSRGNYPPTEAQRKLLVALSAQARVPIPHPRTRAEASREIDRLKDTRRTAAGAAATRPSER